MSDRTIGELNPPEWLLLGPGPANIPPRVHRAMVAPLVGHLDPAFVAIMDETVHLLRRVFRTENQLTIPVSGTGSAAMEAALCNVVETGDTVVIGVNGYFGTRLADMASRYGAKVVCVEVDWGMPIKPEQIEGVLKKESKVKLVAVVHAETSTGALQPLKGLAELVRSHDALLLVDAVTSLGGVDLRIDDWGIDILITGSQKALMSPPGLGFVGLGQRAVRRLEQTESVGSYCLDLRRWLKSWGSGEMPFTPPVNLIRGLRVALEMIEDKDDFDCLVVPIGGGGLMSGMATVARALKPDIEMVGVQAELYPSMYSAVTGDERPCGGDTLAEGIAVKAPGQFTRQIIAELVDDVLLVPEAALEHAVALLLQIEKTVVEGAGAAGLAAILSNPDKFRGKTVGLVLCGGNIDTRLLANVLLRDLARSGRLARLQIVLQDRPGALFKVMREFNEHNVNIIEIYHQRIFTTLPAKGLTAEIECEARDGEQIDRLVNSLRDKGYVVEMAELA